MNYSDVYVALDLIEAGAVSGILEAAGLEVRIRDMGITPYPVSFGPLGEKRIAVPEDEAEEARRLLRRAVEDGILQPWGRVLEE